MAVAKRRSAGPRLMPAGLEKLLKGAAIRTFGCLLMLFAAASWLCLATWSFTDPSLNNATSQSVQNLLGILGAAWADLVMQMFGLTSVFLFIPLATWGWRLAARNLPLAITSRLLAVPIAAFILAFTFSLSPYMFNWPLPQGLGGIVGDFFLTQTGTGSYSNFARIALATVMAPLAIFLLLFASAIRISTLWAIWAEDFHFIGHVILLVFLPFFKGIADWIASFSFRPQNQRFVEWRSIIDKMENEEEDSWPVYEEEPPQPVNFRKSKADRSLTERIEPHFGSEIAFQSAPHSPEHHPHYEMDERRLGYVSPNRKPPSIPLVDDGPPSFEEEIHHQDPAPSMRPARRRPSAPSIFRLPHLRLLKKAKKRAQQAQHTVHVLQQNARMLESILQDFGVKGEIVRAHPGPVVTLYELEPARGVKSSRVIGLADDIARSMSAVSARVAVIPRRNAIGIELPNDEREMVYLRELFETESFAANEARLPLALGKDIAGDPVIADLTRMPHLLIAGTTGSGKSVGINTMIASLLYRLSPEECKLILIDPKMLELSVYDGIPHLLTPVVTEPRKAIAALKWTIREMEERYKKMSKLGVRNISGFNERLAEQAGDHGVYSKRIQVGFDPNTGRPLYETEEIALEPMPFIVVVIDEMADLMMVAGKDIEAAVQRLAQMARAAGIHLITATQRPSVDVITGTIKANFPTRISFRVTSKVDSRTILGEQGSEQLLGDGDMLYMSEGGTITRVHGPFVSDDEIETLVDYLKAQGTPDYLESVTEEIDGPEEDSSNQSAQNSGDELYDRAVAIVLRDRRVSTSYIQRCLSIGYNKAAKIVERMEQERLISPANKTGKREILVGGD